MALLLKHVLLIFSSHVLIARINRLRIAYISSIIPTLFTSVHYLVYFSVNLFKFIFMACFGKENVDHEFKT